MPPMPSSIVRSATPVPMDHDERHIRPLPNRRVVVQKFGGTSVGTGKNMLQIVDIVKSTLEHSNPVVVVSALSSRVKADGTTTRLLKAAQMAIDHDMTSVKKLLNMIKTTHIVAIHDAMGDTAEGATLQHDISEDIDNLMQFLSAIQVIGELSPRSVDAVIGVGESLSAKVLAAVMRHQGVDAVCVDLSTIMDRGLTTADLYGDLRRLMAGIVGPEVTRRVPVVTGYFGDVPGGMLQVVGRGYTDLTAAMIAAELQVHELQLWKEVDGIFSADPRKIKSAKVLSKIAPEEAAELSWFGSEVIHPFTMEHVVKANVPIRIKNTLNPAGEGTLIRAEPPCTPHTHSAHAHSSRPTAVTVKDEVSVINIHSNSRMAAHAFSAKVFGVVHAHQLDVCMVSTSTVSVSLCVANGHRINACLEDLRALGNVSFHNSMAIVSVVGKEMRATVGMSGMMFGLLSRLAINIEMISQGASEINISCLVSAPQAVTAMAALHDYMILGQSFDTVVTSYSPAKKEPMQLDDSEPAEQAVAPQPKVVANQA